MKDKEFHFTEQWLKFYLQAMVQYQILVPGLAMPRQFLALSRLYWGKFNLMVKLDATANFHRLTMPYIEGQTQSLPVNHFEKMAASE